MSTAEKTNKPLLKDENPDGEVITDKDVSEDTKKKYKTNRLNEEK